MNVILLEKINNLGALGDEVSVKSGFGRNYLIPQGKALAATTANVEMFKARRAELEKVAQESLQAAQSRAEQLNGTSITIARKAGNEGKMFGSVTNQDIAEAITNAGSVVEKREVRLPMGAIREIGEYDIDIAVHSDVAAQIKLVIEAE